MFIYLLFIVYLSHLSDIDYCFLIKWFRILILIFKKIMLGDIIQVFNSEYYMEIILRLKKKNSYGTLRVWLLERRGETRVTWHVHEWGGNEEASPHQWMREVAGCWVFDHWWWMKDERKNGWGQLLFLLSSDRSVYALRISRVSCLIDTVDKNTDTSPHAHTLMLQIIIFKFIITLFLLDLVIN